jgi:hypothetical protein
VATFRDTLGAQLELIARPESMAQKPLELWAMDESRFGLQTIARRRLTLPGIKPIGHYQHQYENLYVYGAVAPRTGEGLFYAKLSMRLADFQAFLDDFAATYPDTFNVMLLDNAKSHHASALKLPPNVALLFLPPYAPELNPAERVWQAIKNQLAWLCFDDLFALQDRIADIVHGFDPDAFRSLVAYPYLLRPGLAA